MKNKATYLVITLIVVMLIAVFLYRKFGNNKISFELSSISDGSINNNQENKKLTADKEAIHADTHEWPENSGGFDEQKTNSNNSENILEPGLNRVAFDMSRELCKQEREWLEEILGQDSKRKPSSHELINLLKKAANSKCSSFRKINAHELFFNFNLNEKNYKKFLQDFTLILWDYQGTIPLKLMRASMNELEHAKPEEVKPLRDAILFALNNTINDSSAFIDIGVSIAVLKELSEKGLLTDLTPNQINNIGQEFRSVMQAQLRRNNESRKNHDYPVDKMADYLDFEDAKIELKLIREEYEAVDKFRTRLSGFMKKIFR